MKLYQTPFFEGHCDKCKRHSKLLETHEGDLCNYCIWHSVATIKEEYYPELSSKFDLLPKREKIKNIEV